MNPRYKSNKKWAEFPADLTAGISDIFKQNFKTQLGTTTNVHVSGRFYEKEILVQVGLHRKGELRYNNFEVSLDHKNEPDKVIELVYVAVDAIASLLLDYFENEDGEIQLPYTWMEYPFNDHKVWLQFSTENPELKDAADKLLGESDDSLLKEVEEESADILDATEEDFDEFAKNLEPQMFKSKNKKEDMH